MCSGQAVNYLLYNWPGEAEIKMILSADPVKKKLTKTIKNKMDWRKTCLFRYSDKYRESPSDIKESFGLFFPPPVRQICQDPFLSKLCPTLLPVSLLKVVEGVKLNSSMDGLAVLSRNLFKERGFRKVNGPQV